MMKTLSAIALVTAALSSPVFAQDEAAGAQKPVHALRHHYRGAYNQVQTPALGVTRSEGYGDPSFDRSRIGDHDADFNPSGN